VIAIWLAVGFYFLNALFQLIHWAKFAKDGVGVPGLDDASIAIEMVSQVIFLTIILLLVKGWLISTHFVNGFRILILIVLVFSLLYIALYIWYLVGTDPAAM
jgi:hypothetical protein